MTQLAARCDLGLGKLYRRQMASEKARLEFESAIRRCREFDMDSWLDPVPAEAKKGMAVPLLPIH